MGKMEDTYIFKYLPLLLYCWAGLGVRMCPSLWARPACCAPKRRYQTATAVSTSRIKSNLRNLGSCDGFKLNIRTSWGGCNFTDSGRSRPSAPSPEIGWMWMAHVPSFAPTVPGLSVGAGPAAAAAPGQDAQHTNSPAKGHKSLAPHPLALHSCLLPLPLQKKRALQDSRCKTGLQPFFFPPSFFF